MISVFLMTAADEQSSARIVDRYKITHACLRHFSNYPGLAVLGGYLRCLDEGLVLYRCETLDLGAGCASQIDILNEAHEHDYSAGWDFSRSTFCLISPQAFCFCPSFLLQTVPSGGPNISFQCAYLYLTSAHHFGAPSNH